MKNHVKNHVKTIEKMPQVGDERPLTQGKFSPDSQLFATSSWSGFVKLWKTPSCDPVRRLVSSCRVQAKVLTIRGHEDRPAPREHVKRLRCNTIAWSPQCKGVPPFEGNTVRLASAAADSRPGKLVSLQSFARINLWSLSDSQPVNSLEGHEASRCFESK